MFEQWSLADLSASSNGHHGKIIFCKILGPVMPWSGVRRSYIASTSNGDIFTLTLYNLKPTKEGTADVLKQWDEVAIASPEVLDVRIETGSSVGVIAFRSVRVENPLQLSVNGRRLNPSVVASIWMSTSNRAD